MMGARASHFGDSRERPHEGAHDAQDTAELGTLGVNRCVRALEAKHEFLNWQGNALVARQVGLVAKCQGQTDLCCTMASR